MVSLQDPPKLNPKDSSDHEQQFSDNATVPSPPTLTQVLQKWCANTIRQVIGHLPAAIIAALIVALFIGLVLSG